MSILEFEPSKNPFKYVYADITHRCQMKCENCYLPNRDIPDMDIELFLDCVAKFPRKTGIRLVGGEPTLRQDLPEIVSRIKALGHRPVLITNGLKLADRMLTQRLYAAGLRYLQLSMNGFDDDRIYAKTDQMRCASAKMTALKNCDDVGLSTAISCILIRGINDHFIPRLIEHAFQMQHRPRINLRNVGALGRNMTSQIQNFSMFEIIQLVSNATNIAAEKIESYRTADNQIHFPIHDATKPAKTVWIKITDWSIYDRPELDSKRDVRGRITPNFKVASCFEHIVANEFSY